ncbi:hypothetical protein Back11_49640 [Paenibacillus baekrokdamisoli]|uniref:Uncharacterized protein n=1 Tax=Paenibacillus baekrokdamisoli TaxID=1712516 RepID=A0A3G9JKP7_9BACL|nr:hypothetical protein [Paenibacillus baekrokdamisoli]BBH23619.1 hypothetical protein Back11_49640 [Paenibacillus baekrokdamisoli]
MTNDGQGQGAVPEVINMTEGWSFFLKNDKKNNRQTRQDIKTVKVRINMVISFFN